MTFAALSLSFLAFGSILVYSSQQGFDDPEPWKAIRTSWAMYSPYVPAANYHPPVAGCAVNQVNLIQRHGARYPTSGLADHIIKTLRKVQSVEQYNSPSLEFLKNYTYELGGAADLVPFGALQSLNSGREFFTRYMSLVQDAKLPFVRASSSQRVVDSATNWTAGFSAASDGRYTPVLDLIISETGNDNLDNAMCPNVGDSDSQVKEWLSVSTTAVLARLNNDAPGANLGPKDAYNLLALCPLETVAKEKLSPFCRIFADEEFGIFEYAGDLDKYYGTGYGQDLGPVQGVGYINELIARLTGTPVSDSTQTNRTLDSSPITFPLDRSIYADFSHDNQLIAIYSALGLFKPAEPLSTTNVDADRTWVASKLVPFSGRMVVERVECQSRQYVRIFVNDALQPLEFCGAREDGMCALEDFLESQTYARSNGEGDFEKCFDS
jgi:hypothetical protein